MKLGLLLYLPPPRVPHTQVFWDHFLSLKTRTELILYSEHPWPGSRRLKADPEQFKGARFPNGELNKFALPNATFFTGLRIAMLEGFSHVLVVEPDCRFARDFWDVEIWDEYFGLGFPAIAAGTLATYNPCNFSPAAARKWESLVQRNLRKNFPIATYGWVGAGVKAPSYVFPNGALAVYDVEWMKRFFDLHQTMQFATSVTAWDMAIGIKVWEQFAEESYDVLGHLNCIYSGYGDIVSTEDERRALLTARKVCAVHQIKSDWVPA